MEIQESIILLITKNLIVRNIFGIEVGKHRRKINKKDIVFFYLLDSLPTLVLKHYQASMGLVFL